MLEYTVKISGCTEKEIPVKQQKITAKEISKKAGLSEDTLYKVDDHIVSPQTEIELYDGINLECGDFGGAS